MEDNTKEILEIKTTVEFDSLLKEDNIKVFLFTAFWNRPGNKMEKVLEQISDKYESKIKVFKIDIENKEMQEIAIKYLISSFPTTVIFKKDSIEDQLVGVVSDVSISNRIESLF